MSREIMQQALDALENAKIVMGNLTSDNCSDCMYIPVTKSIAALKAELAKPQQEPVKCTCGYAIGHPLVTSCSCKPRKEWVGLTSEELAQLTIDNIGYPTRLTAALEAKLKEKNTTNQYESLVLITTIKCLQIY